METIRASVDTDYSFISKAWHSYKGKESEQKNEGYPALLTPSAAVLAVALSAWLIINGVGVPIPTVPILKLILFACFVCCLLYIFINLVRGSKPVTGWAEKNLFGSDLAHFTATFFDYEIAVSSSKQDLKINYEDISNCFESRTGLCFKANEKLFFIPNNCFPPGMLPLAKSRLNIRKKFKSQNRTSILSPAIAFLVPFIAMFLLAAERIDATAPKKSAYQVPRKEEQKSIENKSRTSECNINLDAVTQARSESILFLGNSITSAEGIPDKVCEILNEGISQRGKKYFCYSVTKGGAWLGHHYLNSQADSLDCWAQTLREAKELSWDQIILQEQSMVAGLDPQGQYYPQLLKGIKGLHYEFKPKNYFYLFQTWGFVEGDKNIHSDRYTDFETMHAHLRKGFHAAKDALAKDRVGISLIPVGDGFAELKKKDESMFRALYASDRHPSALGSNLAALIIAKKIKPRARTEKFRKKYLKDREDQLLTTIIKKIYP